MKCVSKMERGELKVVGMACAGCSGAVETTLRRLDGVSEARVDLGRKTAYVQYDSRMVSIEDLIRAVEGEGYRIG